MRETALVRSKAINFLCGNLAGVNLSLFTKRLRRAAIRELILLAHSVSAAPHMSKQARPPRQPLTSAGGRVCVQAEPSAGRRCAFKNKRALRHRGDYGIDAPGSSCVEKPTAALVARLKQVNWFSSSLLSGVGTGDTVHERKLYLPVLKEIQPIDKLKVTAGGGYRKSRRRDYLAAATSKEQPICSQSLISLYCRPTARQRGCIWL